ncbi:retinitis pigmentosa 1-like 1 protein [Alligator sinensis]|uniref:Retinitis pigmentosa 1-like 1 protein n=1 Tax=Alligator sinensis TaxID=38654 RepID=A0A1U7SMS8_ALLSI|nr:retinitis pigmentosa 1-like 1 protein [Alligator sinensis]
MRRDKPQERAASWPADHVTVLIALWAEAAAVHDLSSRGRNRVVYDGISQRLAELGIYRTGDQCREKMKGLKVAYRKAKENNAAGRPPMRCPFYEEMDQIMRRCASTGAGFLSEAGDGALAGERPEGAAPPEAWGPAGFESWDSQGAAAFEHWESQASASDQWGSQAAASESQGAEDPGCGLSEGQDALGEVQAVRVKEEEASEEELPPEPGPSTSMAMEPEAEPRQLSALDRLAHLRARKRKAREEGPAEAARGTGPKHGRTHPLELKRARRASAWRAEERQSLVEFMQHDREMRREERDFQAQLLERLLQRQLEALQALAQAPASQEHGELARAEGPGAGLQFQALLEQAVRGRGRGKETEAGAVELRGEPEAAGKAPASAPAPATVQYWTADEILRWLVPQQPVNGQQPRCRDGPQGPRPLLATGPVPAPATAWWAREQRDAEAEGAGDTKVGAEDPMARQRFLGFRYEVTAGPREAYSRLQELCQRWLRPEAHSKEQVLEQLVLEQFLSLLPEQAQRWVREQRPESGPEAVGLAEDFLLAQCQARRLQPQVLEPSCGGAMGPGTAEQVPLMQGQREPNMGVTQEDHRSAGSLDPRGPAASRVCMGGLETVASGRSRAAPARSRLAENGLESLPGAGSPEELQAAMGRPLKQHGTSWGQDTRAPRGATARGSHTSKAENGAEPPADRIPNPCGRSPRCLSPKADSSSPRADPGSPWDVDSSTNGRSEGGAACPGGQRLCQGCAVLRAQLEAAQEELREARASPLLGLSSTALRDLQAALGTISRVLSERRLPTTKAPRDVTQGPGKLLPADTHLS